MKTAILILSDPKSGSDEALGRLFNGLAAAYDVRAAGGEATILFQGAGTRWITEVSREDHPAHALYQEVSESVAGISCGCADVFGGAEVTEAAAAQGLDLITDNPVPGTSGLPSLARLQADGYTILTF